MNIYTHTSRYGRRHGAFAGGFTLIEILVTLFILGIGLSSIVAVFYGAVRIQQRSVGEVEASSFARNAEAILRAKGIREGLLVTDTTTTADTSALDVIGGMPPNNWDEGGNFVLPLPQGLLPLGRDFVRPAYDPENDDVLTVSASDEWRLNDRVSPQGFFFLDQDTEAAAAVTAIDPVYGNALSQDTNIDKVKFLWVPLIQDTDPTLNSYNWRVFLFILRVEQGDYMIPDGGSLPWFVANIFDGNVEPDVPPADNDPFNDVGGRRLPYVVNTPATPFSPNVLTDVVHAGYIHIGDQILISNGVIATVTAMNDINGNGFAERIELDTPHQLTGVGGIWFSPSASTNTDSPTVLITTLESGVIR